MGLRDIVGRLDRGLDDGFEHLPTIPEPERRPRRLRLSGIGGAARATVERLDSAGDRYGGRLSTGVLGGKVLDAAVGNPKKVLIVILAITMLMAPFVIPLLGAIRGELEIYLPPDYESTRILNEVREDWSTDILVIYVESDNVNRPGQGRNITNVTALGVISWAEGDDNNREAPDEMDRGMDFNKSDFGDLDGVMFVLSVSTLVKELNSTPPRFMEAVKQELPVPVPGSLPGGYSIPPNQETVDRYLEQVGEEQKKSLVKDTNGDGIYDTAAIVVGLKKGVDQPAMVAKIDGILGKANTQKIVSMTNTGPVTVVQKIQKRTVSEFIKLLPVTIVFLMVALMVFHRTWKVIPIALVPVLCALAITLGLVGAVVFFRPGFLIISPQIVIAAPMLLALGVSYGLYIANRFVEEPKNIPEGERMKRTARFMHGAILLSAVTTGIGFFSLLFGTLPPIATLGLTLGIGIMLTYTLTMVMAPCLVMLLKYKKKYELTGWKKFSYFPSKHPVKIVLVFAVVAVISVASIGSVRLNADYLLMSPQDEPAVIAMQKYSKNMGGGQLGMIIVRADMKDIDVLDVIDEMEQAILEVPNSKPLSIVDLMKMVQTPENVTVSLLGASYTMPANITFWELLHSGPVKGIPALQSAMMDIFYNSLSDEMRGMLVNRKFTKALIYIDMPVMDVVKTEVSVRGVDRVVDEQGIHSGGSTSHLTGVAKITLDINNLIIQGQFISVGLAIALSMALLAVWFRNLKLGILTMIPCTVVVAWEPMTLAGLNIPLSTVTVMIGSIAIGTGVDFSIQITQRVRQGGLSMDSIRDSVENAGVSFLEATVTMVTGFTAIWTVPIRSMIEFVVMIQILLVYNAIVALFLLPAIYTLVIRRREARRRTGAEKTRPEE